MFKMTVEVWKIIKAAFITDIRHGFIRFCQKFARVSDSHFNEKTGKSLFYPGFEIPAESIGCEMRDFRNLLQADLLREII